VAWVIHPMRDRKDAAGTLARALAERLPEQSAAAPKTLEDVTGLDKNGIDMRLVAITQLAKGRVMKEPSECKSMSEVRAGVDALDEEIMTLLGLRMRFMEAAARIKTARGQVRDEPRKAAVIAHAKSVASRVGFSPLLAADLYELIVEASIAHELECFDDGPRVSGQRA